jgi:hypothetical protein
MRLLTIVLTGLLAVSAVNGSCGNNCARELLDPDNSDQATAFCSLFLDGIFLNPLPTYVSACKDSIPRISSACNCIVTVTPSLTTRTDTTSELYQ